MYQEKRACHNLTLNATRGRLRIDATSHIRNKNERTAILTRKIVLDTICLDRAQKIKGVCPRAKRRFPAAQNTSQNTCIVFLSGGSISFFSGSSKRNINKIIGVNDVVNDRCVKNNSFRI